MHSCFPPSKCSFYLFYVIFIFKPFFNAILSHIFQILSYIYFRPNQFDADAIPKYPICRLIHVKLIDLLTLSGTGYFLPPHLPTLLLMVYFVKISNSPLLSKYEIKTNQASNNRRKWWQPESLEISCFYTKRICTLHCFTHKIRNIAYFLT